MLCPLGAPALCMDAAHEPAASNSKQPLAKIGTKAEGNRRISSGYAPAYEARELLGILALEVSMRNLLEKVHSAREFCWYSRENPMR